MLKFKDYVKLHEELTPKEKAQVAKWPKRTEAATKATDHYFGQGVEDRYTELHDDEDKSEVHKDIERHLGKQITKGEYRSGQTIDEHGRPVKIGRLLVKSKAPDKLARGFENDTTRQGKKFQGLTVRTTRSAEGVAGQTSHNQSWEQESCKNFNDGCHNDVLPKEVQHGTVVHYLHDQHGNEIARATSQPYINRDGHTMYATDSHYGIRHKGFMDHVDQANEELSGERKKGSDLIYHKHPDVYDDNHQRVAIHPSAKESHLTKALGPEYPEQIRIAALKHKNITPEHLTKVQNEDDSPEIQQAVAESRKAEPKHIEKALRYSYSDEPAKAAAANPNASYDNLHEALNHSNSEVHEAAISNSGGNLHHSHIVKALDSPNPKARAISAKHRLAEPEDIEKGVRDYSRHVALAALSNKKVNANHVDIASKQGDSEIKLAAFKHPKASAETLHNSLKALRGSKTSEDVKLKKAIASHKNLSESDMDHTLNSEWEHDAVRAAAASNPNMTSTKLGHALGENNPHAVRVAAAGHDNLTHEQIHGILSDKEAHPDMKTAALSARNADETHYKAGLADNNPRVRNAAFDKISNKNK